MANKIVIYVNGRNQTLSGNANGDIPTWDSATSEWVPQAGGGGGGSGTVTSVKLDAGTTGLTISGGSSQTITTSGTFLLAGTLAIGNGGTGLTSAGGVANRVLLTTNGTSFSVGQVPNAALANASVTVTAGTGLSGGGSVALGASVTLSLPNVGTAATYGSATQVPVFTTDAQGRVSSVTNTTITGLPLSAVAGPTGVGFGVTSATGVWAAAAISGTGQLVGFNGSTPSAITVGTGLSLTGDTLACTVTGTVTSIKLDAGTTGLTVNGGADATITTNGTFLLAGTLAGANGGTGQNSYTKGDLLYAAATGSALSKLGVGADGQILTLASGLPTWAAAPAGGVTGVTAGTGLNVGAGPGGTITTSGTLNLANTTVTAAAYGATAAKTVSFTVNAQGQLTTAAETDIAIAASQVTSGQLAVARGGTGVATTAANKVFAGPTSGADAAPSFRALVSDDLPTIPATKLSQNPYDFGGEFPGTPQTGEECFHYVACRAFTLPAGTDGAATCETAASGGTTTFDVLLNGASIGSIVYTSGNPTGTLTINAPNKSIVKGDKIMVKADAANLYGLDTPSWQFFAYI